MSSHETHSNQPLTPLYTWEDSRVAKTVSLIPVIGGIVSAIALSNLYSQLEDGPSHLTPEEDKVQLYKVIAPYFIGGVVRNLLAIAVLVTLFATGVLSTQDTSYLVIGGIGGAAFLGFGIFNGVKAYQTWAEYTRLCDELFPTPRQAAV